MSALRPAVRDVLRSCDNSVAAGAGVIVAAICMIRIVPEMLDFNSLVPISQWPTILAWYSLMNLGLTCTCYVLEPKAIREHPRFEVYPRWGTATSCCSHLIVHGFCAAVIWARLAQAFMAGTPPGDDAEGKRVSPVMLHALAGASAIMIRDFIAFAMDWTFFAHHAVVLGMSVVAWLWASPEQWALAGLVCATMEVGSFGYDVFIMSSQPLSVTPFYRAVMLASHSATVGGLALCALHPVVPRGVLFWVLSPIIVVFAYLRHGATGDQIATEQDRQGKEK